MFIRSDKQIQNGKKKGARKKKASMDAEYAAKISAFVDRHFRTDGQHKGNVIVETKQPFGPRKDARQGTENDTGKDAEKAAGKSMTKGVKKGAKKGAKESGGKPGMKLVGFRRADRLAGFVSGLHFNRKNSYYITANSFTKGKRCRNDAFTLHNIVIDLDCHRSTDMTAEEFSHMLHGFVFCLQEDFQMDYGCPPPNTAVCTGRGLQLWWALEPCSAECAKMYGRSAEYIIKKVGAFLSDNADSFPLLSIDKSASGSLAGTYRLPMTFNPMSGTYGWMEDLGGRPLDLAAFWAEAHEDNCSKVPVFMRRPVTGSPEETADKRCSAIFELVRMRVQDGSDAVGFRDNACFCLYNSMVQAYGDEKALAKTLELNASFPVPLRGHELMTYLGTSRNKAAAGEPYLLRNREIISRLDISAEEQKHIRLFSKAQVSSAELRAAARKKKESRNETIRALAKKGMSKKAIADAAGCSAGTVASVLKERGQLTEKEKARRKAFREIIKGLPPKKVAQVTGRSIQNIRKLAKLVAEKGYDTLIGKKHLPPQPEPPQQESQEKAKNEFEGEQLYFYDAMGLKYTYSPEWVWYMHAIGLPADALPPILPEYDRFGHVTHMPLLGRAWQMMRCAD